MAIEIPDCRKFTGYKPCHPGERGETCISPEPVGKKILIINIGALGAVLMTTTMLPAVKRKYPESTIHWLTMGRATALLNENPYVDYVHSLAPASLLVLQQIEFDVVYNLDKTQEMGALTNMLRSGIKLGFGLNGDGVVVPLNEGAEYNYEMGLNNKLKFQENTRTYLDIIRETCELDRQIDPYVFEFTEDEKNYIAEYRSGLDLRGDRPVAAINTGSSVLFPYRRLPLEQIKKLIPALYDMNGGQRVLIVGGTEDTKRNAGLEKEFSGKVINTPTNEGLRRGMAYVSLCDHLLTGDTLGLHMAVALKKHATVWFNISCAAEIELYGRGEKIVSEVECSPCWKQECDLGLVCLEEDIAGQMLESFERYLRQVDSGT